MTIHIGMNFITQRQSPCPRVFDRIGFASCELITDGHAEFATGLANDVAILPELLNRTRCGGDHHVGSTENHLASSFSTAGHQCFEVLAKLVHGDAHHVVQSEADRDDRRMMPQHVLIQTGESIGRRVPADTGVDDFDFRIRECGHDGEFQHLGIGPLAPRVVVDASHAVSETDHRLRAIGPNEAHRGCNLVCLIGETWFRCGPKGQSSHHQNSEPTDSLSPQKTVHNRLHSSHWTERRRAAIRAPLPQVCRPISWCCCLAADE